MARTRLFARVRRALIEARRVQGIISAGRALSRRRALLLGAATAAAAACSTLGVGGRRGERIAIVGGGAAGLTVAYRLGEAGRRCTLYEASPRLGGRMFTRRDFTAEGQFCELGGELVDSNHEALIGLAGELRVPIQRIAPEGERDADLYDIGGRLRRASDMLDPETGKGAFAPLASLIAADQESLLDADENWTARARTLDSMSLKTYLDALRPLTEKWAIDLLDIAYLGEYGQPTAQQSALNLVDFIGADPEGPFEVFGESDEAHRIAGGSSSLIEALSASLGGAVSVSTGHRLTAMSREEGALRLVFDVPGGRVEETFDRVVLALPFTLLRGVEGVGGLGLSPEKQAAIAELGYGNNAKLMVATRARPWTSGAAAFNGALYSDRGMQIVWETSRGQPGAGGVLTNFMAGARSDLDEGAALASLTAGLTGLSPALGAAVDPTVKASFFWNRYPHSLGSYASPRPGQYTRLLEAAATPELGGRLHFAGEHTSADFLGFMNGAVESGERAAEEVLGQA